MYRDLNARGVPGRVHPVPMKTLDASQAAKLLDEPLVRKLVAAAS